jgi:PAS domain S-box-containing protein
MARKNCARNRSHPFIICRKRRYIRLARYCQRFISKKQRMPTPLSDADAAESMGPFPESTPLPVASSEYDGLLWLARLHFGLSAVLLTWEHGTGLHVLGIDGPNGEGLPTHVLTKIRTEFETPGMVFLSSAMRVSNACYSDDEGAADSAAPLMTVEWPGFFIAGALREPDGRLLGALGLFGAADAAITLNDAHRAFLHELTTLVVRTLVRGRREASVLARSAHLEAWRDLTIRALTGSGTGVWDRDVPNGVIHYSPAWKAILGYEEHELSDRIEDAYGRLHPDDRAHVQATMQAHFESQTDTYAVEHRVRCKDGSYKWICSRGKVILRDTDGRALRMVGTTTDITALREMAARLQQTNDLITNLTNEVPGLVFEYKVSADGSDRRFSYVSDGIRDIYELTQDDVAHNSSAITARIDPRDVEAVLQSLRDSAASLTLWEQEYRVVLPRQGLCWRHGHARPQRMPDGGTVWHGFTPI